ncbi:AEC family transporter [Brevibacterium samyangense]|uniref:AEC family transporter n=1 Tax=Brevibacterium samyangense TaxID=366888 RepID=A0ABN2T4K7_9MICO
MIGVFEGFGVIAVVIAAGILLGRSGVLGDSGQKVIAKLVFWAATPSLLYTTLAETEIERIFSPALFATGGSALFLALVMFAITRWGFRRGTGESTISAWTVSYVNIGNLGIPIATYVIGDLSFVAPVLLFQLLVLAPLGVALLDSAKSADGSGRTTWWKVVLPVLRNPILIGATVGVICSITGFRLPIVLHDPISMLGAMSVPGALLAFGISLKDGWKLPAPGTRRQLSLITVLKLVVQPVLAWAIAGPLLGYSGLDLFGIVVTCALPTAQNVYIYSLAYNQSERMTRDAVFITTILAIPAILLVAVLLGG